MLKLLCAALLSAATVVASAQDKFPARPIQVIITSTPGSTSDVLTRFLGAEVQKVLGQPLVVIAKPSSSGTTGADQAKRSAPDGYTLFLGGNTTMAANVHLFKNLGYDPVKDFEPVSLVTINPFAAVPVFLSVTAKMTAAERNRTALKACLIRDDIHGSDHCPVELFVA